MISIKFVSQSFSVERFAEEVAEAGASRPLNVLWAHYFLIDATKSSQMYDRIERDFPKKIEMAFLASYLVEIGREEKLEELLELAKTKNGKHLPAINIIALLTRVTI